MPTNTDHNLKAQLNETPGSPPRFHMIGKIHKKGRPIGGQRGSRADLQVRYYGRVMAKAAMNRS